MNKKYPVKKETVETSAKPGGANKRQKVKRKFRQLLLFTA